LVNAVSESLNTERAASGYDGGLIIA